MKTIRNVCLALAAAQLVLASGASAQSASRQMPSATPIPLATPKNPHEILLGTPELEGSEQWEMVFGLRGVRNVSRATVTPFLPKRSEATGAAVIIAPGGGFRYLSIDSEGYEVAEWLAARGVAAFVLKYRMLPTPRDPKAFSDELMGMLRGLVAKPPTSVSAPDQPLIPATALEDAQAALRLVRTRAPEWQVDPARVGFMGFSAGAVLTMGMGLSENRSNRPDFIAPIYGLMDARSVPIDAPPMFLAVALDDPIMARGDLGLINSWRNAGRPIEVHLYGSGSHGFGMTRKNAATALWTDELLAWMIDRKLLKQNQRPK